MLIEKYIIKDRSEEADCKGCGMPLDVGETVYLVEEQDVYCSKGCFKKFIEGLFFGKLKEKEKKDGRKV